MSCNDCPELIPNPNEGCLKPITTDCVTYNGNDIECADVVSGQSLNQVIEQLANNDCELQDQIDNIQNLVNNFEEFSCENLNTCSLDNIGDVEVLSPFVGQVIMFDGLKWVNQLITPFSCSDLNTCNISDLGDVNITTPSIGDILVFNGTNWVSTPQSPAYQFNCNELSNCSIDDLDAGITALNGLQGNGKTTNPVKLGGTLIEDTAISGNFNIEKTIRNFFLLKHVNSFKSNNNLFSVSDRTDYDTPAEFTSARNVYGNSFSKKTVFKGGTYALNSNFNISAHTFSHNIELDATSSTTSNSIPYETIHNMMLLQNLNDITTNRPIGALANLTVERVYSAQATKPTIDNNVGLLIRRQRGYGVPINNSFATYQEGTDDINRFFGEIRYSGALTNVSDKRTKIEKEEFNQGLEVIEKIRPIVFNRTKEFGDINKNHVGIIAQELEEILPIAVSEISEGGFKDLKIFNPETLTYVLINAVKELKIQVDSNKEQYNSLLKIVENQNEEINLLKEQINKLSN